MNKITYPTPQEALAYAENTGRLATKEEALKLLSRKQYLSRQAPADTDWSVFVSRQMLQTIDELVDLNRLEQYDDNFFAAIFPPHQYATTRRMLKAYGIKSTVANRARIMREAARMEARR